MSEFIEIGYDIINKSDIRRIEVTLAPSARIVVICQDGKTLYFPYSNETLKDLKVQLGLDSREKSYNYGVSYAYTAHSGSQGVGFDCFEGVHEKLTANLTRKFAEQIVKQHDWKEIVIMNIINLEG